MMIFCFGFFYLNNLNNVLNNLNNVSAVRFYPVNMKTVLNFSKFTQTLAHKFLQH